MHVLLVQADELLRTKIQSELEAQGHTVTLATKRDEVQLLISNNDVAVLDPDGFDADMGDELVASLRREKCLTPILLLTEKGAWNDKVSSFDCGVDDYLTKPFHGEELIVRTRALARRKR